MHHDSAACKILGVKQGGGAKFKKCWHCAGLRHNRYQFLDCYLGWV
jgi:hypothetical protein